MKEDLQTSVILAVSSSWVLKFCLLFSKSCPLIQPALVMAEEERPVQAGGGGGGGVFPLGVVNPLGALEGAPWGGGGGVVGRAVGSCFPPECCQSLGGPRMGSLGGGVSSSPWQQ